MEKNDRRLCLLLGLTMLLCLTACGKSEHFSAEVLTPAENQSLLEQFPNEGQDTYIFTDATGRQVELPKNITRAASAGPLANIMLYSICPEALAGWSSAPSDTAKRYMDEKYWNLPEYGRFYGNSGSFHREAVMASNPQVIIDIGEWDEAYKSHLDTLQNQVGIPVILLDADLEQTPTVYRTLGALLGREAEGEALASYCEEVIADTREKSASIPATERISVYFGQEDGLSTILSGTLHAQIYEMVGAEIIVKADDSQIQHGGGTVSMEQLMLWDPEVILFAEGSIFDIVEKDAAWAALSAIQNGLYYEIPSEPYNWLGRPPGPNRFIGMRWLGNLLYPHVFDYDIAQEIKTYFNLFYHYELSDVEVQKLLSRSTWKDASP